MQLASHNAACHVPLRMQRGFEFSAETRFLLQAAQYDIIHFNSIILPS